jgi:hypothetical protein
VCESAIISLSPLVTSCGTIPDGAAFTTGQLQTRAKEKAIFGKIVMIILNDPSNVFLQCRLQRGIEQAGNLNRNTAVIQIATQEQWNAISTAAFLTVMPEPDSPLSPTLHPSR